MTRSSGAQAPRGVGMWGWMGEFSVVPTVVVDAGTMRPLVINMAGRQLLGLDPARMGGTDLQGISHPDDAAALASAVQECSAVEGTTRYLRHRWTGPDGTDVTTEMAVVGCGTGDDGTHVVLMQMRNAAADWRLSVFVRLLADNPDGGTVMDALVAGPLGGMAIRVATVYAADFRGDRLVLLGSHGMSEANVGAYSVTPLNRLHPGGATVLDSEVIWVSMRALADRFPLAANDISRQEGLGAAEALSLPVLSRGRPVGTVFLVADRPFPRTWAFHDTLTAVSQSLALWILLRRESVRDTPLEVTRASRLVVTDRERDILRLVGEGLTNGEIGRTLGYSEATVRADLGRLAKMLGVSGRREIVRRAAELGL